MREVEVTAFVPVTVPELERVLSPRELLEYEGTFTVETVTEAADSWQVTARAGGMSAVFRVEERDDGYYYEQEGEAGPFERMETTLSYERYNEGTNVTLRSAVSLGLPLAGVTDRIAAWKRRGELERAADALADAATTR